VPVAIRSAKGADDARLAEIDQLTWSPAVSPLARPPAGSRFFEGGLEPEHVLVAEFETIVAGYVALAPPTRLSSGAHVQAIHGLAVAPAYQRRGIGRQLLEAAIEEARRRGAQRLRLRVLATNEEALRLYAAVGFEREGALRGEFRIGGRYVDDLFMAIPV
jgi:ribosomal protein S18 acetylase RimI-like enzyme